MSIKNNYIILCCFLLLSFGAQAQITVKPAEKAVQGIGRKLEQRAKEEVQDEVAKQKSTLKNDARTTVQDLKKLPNRGLGKQQGNTKPSLEELIQDEQVKQRLTNTDNKTRFVSLFGQWWMLPSEQQLKVKLKYQEMLDSISRIDSSKYRFPKKVTDDQYVTIFGWHPHFKGTAYKSYNYDLLSAISYHSYDLDPFTGDALDTMVIKDFLGGEDPAGGIVATAHAKNCKVLLSVTSHSEDNNAIFLEPGNAAARQNLIDQLIYLLDTSKADGVELSFENVPALYQEEFYKFVRKLSFNLRGVNPNYSVCMSVPAYDPNNIFNLGKMVKDVDFFIIKGFDFQYDPTVPSGVVKKPVSPLNFSPAAGEEDLRSVVERYLASIGPFYAHRLILSLANHGSLWRTTDKGHELLDFLPYNEIQYDYVMKDTSGLIRVDSNYFVYVWQRLDTINNGRSVIQTELLFDDVQTFRAKFRFLQEYGLGGVGIWYLGEDEGFEGVWKTIEEEFTTVDIPEVLPMEQITEVSQRARSWSPVLLTILLYWAIFAAAGFCMALLNVEARRRLFQSGFFRMLFLGFFSLLILLLGSFFGLFVGKTSMLMVGVIFGAFFAYGILVILNKQKAKAP